MATHRNDDKLLEASVTLMAGSRELRRKDPGKDNWEANTYWYPWSQADIRCFMKDLFEDHEANQAVLYGEIFGGNTQKNFGYGHKRPTFRPFCLMINGQFVDRDVFHKLLVKQDLDAAPVLYRGPYSLEKIKQLAEGKSEVGGNHMREGVVVRPMKERTDPRIGRVILKYVSDSFLLRKGGDEEDTTDQ